MAERCWQHSLADERCVRDVHGADPSDPTQGHVFAPAPGDSASTVVSGGLADELAQWWRDRAESEIGMVVAKSIEYSATDLRDIGRELVEAGVPMPGGAGSRDEKYTELGIYFYTVGKMSRWKGAIASGRRTSDDTLLDAGVYLRMAQRNRHAGGWPNA